VRFVAAAFAAAPRARSSLTRASPRPPACAARLRGMVLEARGEWEAADAVYDLILAKAPSHEGAQKRKIALLRCAAPRCAARACVAV